MSEATSSLWNKRRHRAAITAPFSVFNIRRQIEALGRFRAPQRAGLRRGRLCIALALPHAWLPEV